MSTWQIVFALTRADVLERVRRYSFLLTMAASVYLGYAAISGYVRMHLGAYRGIYNAAWVGTLVSMSTVLFISLIGFYVIRNSIERDRHTGVGQILAATRMGKFIYIVSKVFSNYIVLSAIVFVQAAASVLMVYMKGEDQHPNLWTLFSPFLFIAMPAIAITAAIAVLFECVGFLRWSLGNVLYFFLWMAMLIAPIESHIDEGDVMNLKDVETSIRSVVLDIDPTFQGGFSFNAGPQDMTEKLKTFQWEGIHWTFTSVFRRLLMFGFALLIASVASFSFDRFDHTGISQRTKRRWKSKAGQSDRMTFFLHLPSFMMLEGLTVRSRFLQMVIAEIRLMLKGQSKWWYISVLGLFITSLFAPVETVRGYILPCLWILPIAAWSGMGVREERFGTDQLIFATPHVLKRQFSAVWLAGVLVALLTASGLLLRLVAGGEFSTMLAVIGGALFIPTLALTFGVWSKSNKLFEAAYIIAWYIGPINHAPGLDFMGATTEAVQQGVPFLFLVITLALFLIAVEGRRRQIHR